MTELLTTLALVFILAGPFIALSHRLDVPLAGMLIIAGVLVAPFIDEIQTLELARWGIALLVFVFGARTRFRNVRMLLRDSEIVAIAQTFVMGSIGIGIGLLAQVPLDQAIILGVAAALSSTMVGTSYLRADIREKLVHGRLAASIHYVQDLIAIGFVLVLGAEVFTAESVLIEFGFGIAFLGLAVLVNRFGFPILERLAGDSDETMLIGIIAILAGFLGAAEYLEVSIVVGAFAAGLCVRYEPVRHMGLFNALESIRDFFLAIFFVTIGALVSVPDETVLGLALVLGVLTAVVKPLVTFALLILEGYEARSATLTSLSLDQVSEFALIIAIEAALIDAIIREVYEAIILAAAATMITSGLTQRYGDRIFSYLSDRWTMPGESRRLDELSTVSPDVRDHVIVVGFGRQGSRVLDRLEGMGHPAVVIENDPTLLESLRSDCEACVFGDAMNRVTWRKARLETATLVVSTVDSARVSRRILSIANDTDVIVRAENSRVAEDLLDLGATYAYVDDTLAAHQLVEYLQALNAGEVGPDELRSRAIGDLDMTEGYGPASD